MLTPVLDTDYLTPKWRFRYASRPHRTTVLLARVRIWLEDPVTGEPTGMTQDKIIKRLNGCKRLLNWSISHNVDFEDEPDGVYGYWDYQDVDAWNQTPGRNPMFPDEDFEMYVGNYMHRFLELRLAFSNKAHPVNADFVKRLCGCKLRDIVICDRSNLTDIPYAEQVRLWLYDCDGDTDFESMVMKKNIFKDTDYLEQDEIVYSRNAEAAHAATMQKIRAQAENVQAPYDDSAASAPKQPVTQNILPATFVAGPDVNAPRIYGQGIDSDEGTFMRFDAVSPYSLTYAELMRATDTKPGMQIDPMRIIDMSKYSQGDDDVIVRSRLIGSHQTTHIGWADVDRTGETPTHYHFDSGNGLCYDIWGRWALIERCKPDEHAQAVIAEDEGLSMWMNLVRPWTTCIPVDVLISAFAWAFPDCEAYPYKLTSGWIYNLIQAGATFPSFSSYAVAWYIYHHEKLGLSEQFLMRDNHYELRHESARIFGSWCDYDSEAYFAMNMLKRNLANPRLWDTERQHMTDHPYHYFGMSMRIEEEMRRYYENGGEDDEVAYDRYGHVIEPEPENYGPTAGMTDAELDAYYDSQARQLEEMQKKYLK